MFLQIKKRRKKKKTEGERERRNNNNIYNKSIDIDNIQNQT